MLCIGPVAHSKSDLNPALASDAQMYRRIYVSMYFYKCFYVQICMNMCFCRHTTHIQTHAYVCMYIYTHMYIYIYIYTCIRVSVYTHTHTHANTYIYMHMLYINIYVYIYIYARTYTRVAVHDAFGKLSEIKSLQSAHEDLHRPCMQMRPLHAGWTTHRAPSKP